MKMDKDMNTLYLLGGMTGIAAVLWYLYTHQTAQALVVPTCEELGIVPGGCASCSW